MNPVSQGLTVWLTGLGGSGKVHCPPLSTGSSRHGEAESNFSTGDDIREVLSKGLSFNKANRDENFRRIGYVAELLTRHGVITLVSAISPYRDARDAVRARIPNFIEVYVNAPLTTGERRDVKGLYRKARAGQIRYFTGIDDPYDPPLHPEVECHTDIESVPESVAKIIFGDRPASRQLSAVLTYESTI